MTFESIIRSRQVREAVRSGPVGPYMEGKAVRRDKPQTVYLAARPPDLDLIDRAIRTETEVGPGSLPDR